MRANLDPAIWGEKGWAFLENCLHAYDPTSRNAYLRFLHVLPEVLPCATCRQHAREFLTAHPPEERHDLSGWVEDFRMGVAERVRPQRCAFHASTLLLLMLLTLVGALVLGFAWSGGGGGGGAGGGAQTAFAQR